MFGRRSLAYDFGPQHPLTPLRFGPGIDLLRSVGAVPGLAPEPATDEALARVHQAGYIEAVRALSRDPSWPRTMGIGHSDNPAFPGMHEAAAAVAGGSLRAMEAILRGDVEHAHHPGGGLHHAMPSRASGFCIYDDPALAVLRARDRGLRVLYLDLDVHHGDGVEAICRADPGALTVSIHESGRYLFPGTGFPADLGEGAAAGTSVNLPLEPFSGEVAWGAAVRSLLPSLAAVFGPDVIVSQHGADSHARDPLAHLRVTTTAMSEAARIVDAIAHRWAGGRWLATGGGGYDAYRVVPRAWALTWLAGAHREPPEETPDAWRERWAGDAARFGTPGMPPRFLDPANAGMPVDEAQSAAEERSMAMLARVRSTVLPRLVQEAEERGWWRPGLEWAGRAIAEGVPPTVSRLAGAATGPPRARSGGGGGTELRVIGPGDLDRLALAPRTIPPFDPADGRALLAGAISDGARVVAAIAGDVVVGVAVAASSRTRPATESLLALGVAPGSRRAGLAAGLLRVLVEGRPAGTAMQVLAGVAERDVVEPLPVEDRIAIARRLLEGAGFRVRAAAKDATRDDPWALAGSLPAG